MEENLLMKKLSKLEEENINLKLELEDLRSRLSELEEKTSDISFNRIRRQQNDY